MLVTLTTPIKVPDLALLVLTSMLLDEKNKIAKIGSNVQSAGLIFYQAFPLVVGNDETTGVRAVATPTDYNNIMENFTLKAPGLYDLVAAAFIKNGGTVDTALQAVATVLIAHGAIPPGAVS